MKRRPLWIAAGALLYGAFLLASAPAGLIASAASHLSEGRLLLVETQGGLWRGKGTLFVTDHRESRRIGRLAWDVAAPWLAAGEVRVALEMREAEADLSGVLALGPRTLSVSALRATIAAGLAGDIAAAFRPPLRMLGPRGRLRIESGGLSIGRDGMAGSAEAVWSDAASAITGIDRLGSYRLFFKGEGRDVHLQLATSSGDLQLEGKGRWRPAYGELRLSGVARPLARAGQLEPLLALIGPDQGAGQRAFSLAIRPGSGSIQ